MPAWTDLHVGLPCFGSLCVSALFVYRRIPAALGVPVVGRVRSQMKNAAKNTFVPQHIMEDFCIKMWIFLLFFFPLFHTALELGNVRVCVFVFTRVVYEICSLALCPLPTPG